MDLQLTRWLLSRIHAQESDLMRLKGILNCQSRTQAVVIQGCTSGSRCDRGWRAAERIPLVLIGRHLNEEALPP